MEEFESNNTKNKNEKKSFFEEAPRSPVHGKNEDVNKGDVMITVRAHNKKTGEVTVMRVKKGTPMKEVMTTYAQSKTLKAEKLSWKRRANVQPDYNNTTFEGGLDDSDDCVNCGCHSYLQII